MSIWDTIKVNNQQSEPTKDGEFFIIQFSTEKQKIRCGQDMSLKRALAENASRLGYDGSRAVTWRDGSGVVAESTIGRPNTTYVASVSLETKG